MKKTMYVSVMCAAILSSACVGGAGEPVGELTGELCFEGDWNTDYYAHNGGQVRVVSDGTFSMRMGRTREVFRRHEGFNLTNSSYTEHSCDFDAPLTIESVRMGGDLAGSIEYELDGRRIDMTTGAAAAGDVVFQTSSGTRTVTFHVDEPLLRELALDVGSPEYPSKLVAGATTAIEYDFYCGSHHGCRGVRESTEAFPWVTRDTMTFVNPFHGEESEWVEAHKVRVTRTPGAYDIEEPFDRERGPYAVSVVSPSEVSSIEICDKLDCVGNGGVLPLIDYPITGKEGRMLSFHVVFRDDSGQVLAGIPDDFSITYPDGWFDLQPHYEGMGSAFRNIGTYDGDPLGEVVVEAYGLTARVEIEFF